MCDPYAMSPCDSGPALTWRVQVAGVINSALQALRDAGAVLVPFDSSPFQQLALAAWPGATTKSLMGNLDAASAYESIEVLGR